MKRYLLATAAVLPFAISPVLAQNANQNSSSGMHNPASDQMDETSISKEDFIRRAATGNQFEIDAAELAMQHSGRDPIKQFAQDLIDDHQNAQKLLRRRAGQALSDTRDQDTQKQLADLRKAGRQFDSLFLQTQIDAHDKAIDLYETYAENGDTPALQRYAESVLPDLKDHLERAQDLQDRLNLGSSDQTAANNQDGSGRQSSPGASSGRSVFTVQQRRAQVEVQQRQPRITIRQPAPKVTIEQAQPHVTVWLAQPSVDVNQPKPRVSLDTQKPRIHVERAGKNDITLNQPDSQPQIDFQQTGSPQVTYRRAAGKPSIEYRTADSNPQRSGSQSAQSSDDSQSARQADARNQNRQDANSRISDTTGTVARNQSPGDADNQDSRRMTVANLVDMNLYNARGNELGDIERVVMDPQTQKVFIVLAAGGFLGMFEDEVAIPLQRVELRNGRLVARGLTQEDVEGMQNWRSRLSTYRVLDDSEATDVTVAS